MFVERCTFLLQEYKELLVYDEFHGAVARSPRLYSSVMPLIDK